MTICSIGPVRAARVAFSHRRTGTLYETTSGDDGSFALVPDANLLGYDSTQRWDYTITIGFRCAQDADIGP